MKKIFISLITAYTFISCEKVIPFEGDVTVSKLVINSIFESDSTFKVHVSSSRSVVDTASFLNIEDADVKILNNDGNIVDVLNHINNGFYMGQTYPEENKTYYLEVKHPNYTNITSLDSLPAPININSIDTTTVIDPINGDRIQINLNFDDPSNFQNYYLLETYAVSEYILVEGIDTLEHEIDTAQQNMILTDVVFQNGGSPWRDQGLFNDLLFNGQNKVLEFEIPFYDESGYEDGYNWSYKISGIRIYLHNISKSYYYYRTSLELYQNTSGNPFAQPVQVYSNIENGFGIFAGSQITYFDL